MQISGTAKFFVGAAAFTAVLAVDLSISPSAGVSFIAPAQAVLGRPLTPLSYAGVARRTTRRAVYVGAVATAPVVVAPAPVVVVQPTCVDTVDAYGRVTRVCR